MKVQQLDLDLGRFKLPNINQLFSQHYYRRNKTKVEIETLLGIFFKRDLQAVDQYPLNIYFEWWNRHKRIDPDNQAGAGQKVILDALQGCGIIAGDGCKHISGLYHSFYYDNQEESLLRIRLVEGQYDEGNSGHGSFFDGRSVGADNGFGLDVD